MAVLRVAILQIVGTLALNSFLIPNGANLLQDPNEPNVCVNGKLLPKLYVLGAKNCGTSSIYRDLKDRGFWNSPNNPQPEIKEWWFFQEYWRDHEETNETEMSLLWFNSLLKCPEQSVIMGDFAVPNLFTVPMPPEFKHSKRFGYPARNFHPNNWNTAELLHKWYGDQGQKVQFVIILREPLARMQSEWYHTRKLHNCKGCMAQYNFARSLEFNTNLALKSTPEITDWMWKSMYARQIEEYIKVWNPNQFMIIPFIRYVGFDTKNVSTSLIKRLRLRLDSWSQAAHDNEHNDRPDLLTELPMESARRKLYYTFMAKENKRLAIILAGAQLKGMELQGYTGKPGDGVDIWNWLDTSW